MVRKFHKFVKLKLLRNAAKIALSFMTLPLLRNLARRLPGRLGKRNDGFIFFHKQ